MFDWREWPGARSPLDICRLARREHKRLARRTCTWRLCQLLRGRIGERLELPVFRSRRARGTELRHKLCVLEINDGLVACCKNPLELAPLRGTTPFCLARAFAVVLTAVRANPLPLLLPRQPTRTRHAPATSHKTTPRRHSPLQPGSRVGSAGEVAEVVMARGTWWRMTKRVLCLGAGSWE